MRATVLLRIECHRVNMGCRLGDVGLSLDNHQLGILSLVTGQEHLKEKSWICGILDLERGRKMNQSIPSFYKLERGLCPREVNGLPKVAQGSAEPGPSQPLTVSSH